MYYASEPTTYEEFCELIELEGLFGATYNFTGHKIFDGPFNAEDVTYMLCIVSLLLSFLVILASWYNKKLTMHPYGLITLITIIDACYIMLFSSFEQLCRWHLPLVFTETVTVPYLLNNGMIVNEAVIQEALFKNLFFLHECAEYLFAVLLLISLLLNICLCLDLYYTVKNPFSKASGKTISVTLVGVILFTAVILFLIVRWTTITPIKQQEHPEMEMVAVVFGMFILIALFTIVSTTRRLLKPGFSKQVRRRVLCNQVRYIVTITFVFLQFFIFQYMRFRDLK